MPLSARLGGLVVVALLLTALVKYLDLGSKEDYRTLSESPVRAILKEELRNRNLTPTHETAEIPSFLSDLSVGPDPVHLDTYFKNLPFGKKTIFIQSNPEQANQIQLQLQFKHPNQKRVWIYDQKQRLVFHCRDRQCQTKRTFDVDPSDAFSLTLESPTPLSPRDRITVALLGGTRQKERNLPIVRLNLKALEILQLKMLTSKASGIARSGKFIFPEERINTQLTTPDGQRADVALSLSGRSGGHFSFVPSLSVKITQGPLLFGSQSFKLYRIQTKSGLADYVGFSLFRDAGVITPYQKLVSLYVNHEPAGLFLFEDKYSPAFFENIGEYEGRILGFDPVSFFKNYPEDVRLKTHAYYDPKKDAGGNLHRNLPDLTSKALLSKLDVDAMAKLIAGTTVLMGTHALGADDLRFYENLVTGKYIPILRDPGFVVASPKNLSDEWIMSSQLFAWSQRRPSSMARQWHVTDLDGRSLSSIGLTDIHPTVVHFLNDPELRALAEASLLKLSRSDIVEVFRRRFRSLYSVVDKMEFAPHFKSMLKEQHTQITTDTGKPYSNVLRNYVKQSGPLVQWFNPRQARIINRSYFSLTVESKLPKTGCATPLSPLWSGAQEASLDYALVEQLFQNQPTRPYCQINFDQPVQDKATAMTFRLADGTPLPEARPLTKGRNLTATPTPSWQFFDKTEEATSLTLQYVYHGPGRPDFSKLALRHFPGKETGPRYSIHVTPLKAVTPLKPGASPTQIRKILGRAYSTFSNQSALIDIKVSKTEQVAYVHFPKDQLARVFNKAQLVEPKGAFLIPPLSSKEERTCHVPPERYAVKEGWAIPPNSAVSIKRPWHIPAGKTLRIESGTTLMLAKAGKIKIEGKIIVRGTPSHPVRFKPKDDHWGGLLIAHSRENNQISHTIFTRAKAYQDHRYQTYGGIAILESRATMTHSKIQDFLSEDAINAYKSEFDFIRSELNTTIDDGLDSDFSTGRIAHSRFIHVGGDSIDMNHSLYTIEHNQIERSGDKGLSVGEKSQLQVRHNHFMGSEWGIAIKDTSIASVKENLFESHEIAIVQLIKKPWYNAPTLFQSENRFAKNTQIQKHLGFYRY